jgi:hypothetical protein
MSVAYCTIGNQCSLQYLLLVTNRRVPSHAVELFDSENACEVGCTPVFNFRQIFYGDKSTSDPIMKQPLQMISESNQLCK